MRISDWSSDVCSSDLVRTRQVDTADLLPCSVDEGLREHRKDIVRIVINTGKVGEDGIGDELGLLLGRGVEHDELGVDRIAERFSRVGRSEEHTSELQSLMRISYAVFCLKKKTKKNENK